MRVKRILGFVGIGFLVLIIGSVGYVYVTDTRPASKTGIINKTAKLSKLNLRKHSGRKINRLHSNPAMPVIKINKPDQDIEKVGVKVAKEKPAGIPARPERYRIVKIIPEKAIKTINCMNGFIVFNSEESMSGVEVMLAVNKYDGVDYYSLADEKGTAGFNYTVVEGDLNGQTRPTVKIFAMGKVNGEYVILECPDVLGSKLSDGVRTICIAPVIAGINSQESARKILEEQFYVSEAGLELLFSQVILSLR